MAQNAITYEDLADPKWKGKICIRSGQHIYNNALFAAVIAHLGEAKAEEWLKGLKANLAQKPSGGDREVARDIAAGKCDIGLGNTYYWALMNDKEADKKSWAEATKVILPSFKDGGTHVNLSGVVLAKHAPNKANAMKLIEWLGGETAQHMYADLNYEYPVRAGIAVNKTIAGYGPLKADKLPIAVGRREQEEGRDAGRQGRLRQLMDRAPNSKVSSSPTAEPGCSRVRPLNKPGCSRVRPLSKPGCSRVRPLSKPGCSPVRPLNKPGCSRVRPINEWPKSETSDFD